MAAVGTDRFDWTASGLTRSSDPISAGGEFREGLFSFALLPAEEGGQAQRGLWSRAGTLGVTGLLGLRGRRAWAETGSRRPADAAPSKAEAPHRVATRLRVAAAAGASVALLAGFGTQVQMATSDLGPEATLGGLRVATVADAATDPGGGAPVEGEPGAGAASGAPAVGTPAGDAGGGPPTDPGPGPFLPPPLPPPPDPPLPGGPLAQVNVAIPGIAVIGIGLGDGSCTGAAVAGASAGCPQDTAAPPGITIQTSGSALPALRIVIPT